MATKTGNGGHGPEAYDPNTGKYIASDKSGTTNLEKYHAGVGYSKQDIISALENNQLDKELCDYYNNGDSSQKQEVIEYIQGEMDAMNTQSDLEKNADFLSVSEYEQLQQDFKSETGLSYVDTAIVHNSYIGTSGTSFYLNTALRFGYEEMQKQYIAKYGVDPEFDNGNYLSRDNFNKFVKTLDKITNVYKVKKDILCSRYVGTGPIVSWFKDTGILEGLEIESTKFHDHLKKGSYSLDDLAKRINDLSGTEIPQDGSAMSVSLCPQLSHMAHKTGEKPIMLKILIPEGNGVYVANNHHESEGLLPRDTTLYLKKAAVEKDTFGMERVMIYCGIKKQ